MTTLPATSDNFAQRLILIRRHLHGIEVALDALEAEIHQRQQAGPAIIPGITGATKPDGERAAQRAREVVYQQGPQEIKVIHDDGNAIIV